MCDLRASGQKVIAKRANIIGGGKGPMIYWQKPYDILANATHGKSQFVFIPQKL